jgi:hypothetical protein
MAASVARQLSRCNGFMEGLHEYLSGVTSQLPAGGPMKKLKNEKELVKKAIAAGMKYGEERGVVEFEPTDSATEKIEYIYRLLVHDKIIQPVPQEQISQLAMKHRLAIWASKLK